LIVVSPSDSGPVIPVEPLMIIVIISLLVEIQVVQLLNVVIEFL